MDETRKPQALSECIDYYIEDCLARGQANLTAKTKENLVGKFVTWCEGIQVYRVNELSLDVLEQYRRYIYRYRKPRNGEPLGLATQRMRLTAVTGFLKFLNYHEFTRLEFYKKFILPKVPKRLPKKIPEYEEIEQIIRQTETCGYLRLRDRAILEVLYATGIRRCEIANLNVRDIDFRNEVIIVCAGKGGLDRVVPIAQRAQHWLKQYLIKLRPQLAQIESGDALFLGINSKRLKASALTDLVRQYILRSGVRNSGACHVFRHATATHMLRNGADIRYVQEFLGHQDIKSTEIYTHVTINDLTRVYKQCHPAVTNDSKQK